MIISIHGNKIILHGSDDKIVISLYDANTGKLHHTKIVEPNTHPYEIHSNDESIIYFQKEKEPNA